MTDSGASEPVEAHGLADVWAVVGASGFIGSHLTAELMARGVRVRTVKAPRIAVEAAALNSVQEVLNRPSIRLMIEQLAEELAGCLIVVSAAGLATPGSRESAELTGANALLPAIVAIACGRAGVRRYVHISSAAVQDRRRILDELPETAARTPYARSKALAEQLLSECRDEGLTGETQVVVYRATSVHAPGRPTTASLARFARSPLASVAGSGELSTPVVSVKDVVESTILVAAHPGTVPPIVLQPWTGATTAAILRELGGREPKHLPTSACRMVVRLAYLLAPLAGSRGRAHARRLELLWFGQRQARTWFDEVGHTAPFGSGG